MMESRMFSKDLARIGTRKEKFALEGQYQEITQGFRDKDY